MRNTFYCVNLCAQDSPRPSDPKAPTCFRILISALA